MNLFFEAARAAAAALHHGYAAHIVERHHAQKKDAPSGTALRIARVESEEQARLVCRMLGCDALLVATVTMYDPYTPPKMGAAIHWQVRSDAVRWRERSHLNAPDMRERP